VVPGGGANAIYNLAELGRERAAGGACLGEDEGWQTALATVLRRKHIPLTGIQRDKSHTTVTKTRILAGDAAYMAATGGAN